MSVEVAKAKHTEPRESSREQNGRENVEVEFLITVVLLWLSSCTREGQHARGEQRVRARAWRTPVSMMLPFTTALLSYTITPLSRRDVAFGLCCVTMPMLRTPLPAEAASDECLTCKLKASLASASDGPTIGTDFGALLPRSAVDVIEVGDPSNFDATMKAVLSKFDPAEVRVLVWVQSELVNGVPWCPDTRVALPMLESALYRSQGTPIVLVSADVVKRDYYSANYRYRRDPQLQLSGVPTLYRWGRDGPLKRLQERQITPVSLDALLA